jgi:hypothetical protein
MDDKVKWHVGNDEYKLKPKPKIKSNTTTNEDYTFFGS